MKHTPHHTADEFTRKIILEVTAAMALGEWKSYHLDELAAAYGSRERADDEVWWIRYLTGSNLSIMVWDENDAWIIFSPQERFGVKRWN